MKPTLRVLTAIILVGAFLGCSDDRMTGPVPSAESPELVAMEMITKAGWAIDPDEATLEPQGDAAGVFGFSREHVVDDIFHYSFDVPLGPGPYDVVGIHRVVREAAPYRPIRTHDSVFLAHGDVADFEQNFLALDGTPVDRAMSVLLARADIDCWGLDFGWSRVPEGTTDFSFFNGWGIGKDVQHVGNSIAIARTVRRFTGSGNQKMHIFGYSGGGQTAFAYLCEETRLPRGKRHVKGFIPFDADPLLSNSPEQQARTCALTDGYQALLDAGVYQDEFGLVFSTAAYLARTAPNDSSPLVEGFNNLQAALFLGAATWNLVDYTPYIHFVAGEFEDGLPVDLRFSPLDTYLEFTFTLNPYFPTEIFRDRYALQCGQPDLPWNDRIADVDVPILFIGAGGGIGEWGLDAVHATSSPEITELLIDLDADRSLDYGHIDVMTATTAPDIVWAPMRDWILAH